MKKNILIVDQGVGFGGSFIVAARLGNALDRNKYKVHIITAIDLELVEHHVASHVNLHFLRKDITYVQKGHFEKRISRFGFRLLQKALIYCFFGYEHLKNSRFRKAVRTFINEHKIDFIHVNNCRTTIDIARDKNIPFLWQIHGPGDGLARQVVRQVNSANKIVAISNFVRENAIASGVRADKIVTILNPISSDTPEIKSKQPQFYKEKIGISPDTLTIGIFGRLVAWKGQLQLLEAINKISAVDTKICVLLVGSDGESAENYTEVLKDYVQSHFSENLIDVHFTGYIKNTENYYRACDIVAHTSITPEPFGLVITEAMEYGAAVIASTHGAGKELVKSGSTGLLADPLNAEELAGQLDNLINDKVLRRNLAENALQYVKSEMGPRNFAEKISQVYEEFI